MISELQTLIPVALRRVATLTVGGLLAAVVAGCAASSHPTERATMGEAVSSAGMLAVLAEPGPVRFEKVLAANWAVPLSGLLNLDHPRARAARLSDREEAIQIYFYVLEHPRFGTFIVDSGISDEFRAPGGSDRLSFIVASAMNTGMLEIRTTTGRWLREHGKALSGVFLTHLHLDHILGVADVGAATPVYTGPGETRASQFLNMFSSGTTDRLLRDIGPLREWNFAPDDADRFAGLIDVFGDRSLFAIHVPGHSSGSTAFLVRTPEGPRLIAGDASHTVWGWEQGVEPGTFSADGPRSAESLAGLRKLVSEYPQIEVHLGHQSLVALAAKRASSRGRPVADRTGLRGVVARRAKPAKNVEFWTAARPASPDGGRRANLCAFTSITMQPRRSTPGLSTRCCPTSRSASATPRVRPIYGAGRPMKRSRRPGAVSVR